MITVIARKDLRAATFQVKDIIHDTAMMAEVNKGRDNVEKEKRIMKKFFDKKAEGFAIAATATLGHSYADSVRGDSEAQEHLDFIEREQREAK